MTDTDLTGRYLSKYDRSVIFKVTGVLPKTDFKTEQLVLEVIFGNTLTKLVSRHRVRVDGIFKKGWWTLISTDDSLNFVANDVIKVLQIQKTIVDRVIAQLLVSDGYAKQNKAKEDILPSVWEIQNSHLRDSANELKKEISSIIGTLREIAGETQFTSDDPVQLARDTLKGIS